MRKAIVKASRSGILDPADLRQILDRITSQLSTSPAPDALFRAVVDIAKATTDAQASSLYLEQEASSDGEPRLVMVEGAGYEKKRVGKASYSKGEGLTGSIWNRSETVKFDSTEELEASALWQGVHDSLVREGDPKWVCSSLVGVPLRIGTRTIGVIKVENKNRRPGHFSERDRIVLELIASTMALAIENRRLSERAYGDILNAIREVSGLLATKAIMPFRALCDSIVNKCVDIFKADACSLYLATENGALDEQIIKMIAGAGYELRRVGVTYCNGQGLTGSIWRNGQSVRFDNARDVQMNSNHQGIHDDMIRRNDSNWVCSSLIGAPLRLGTQIIGVIKVENKRPAPKCFSQEELHSLEILASNIALALNSLNWQREMFWKGEAARSLTHDLHVYMNLIESEIGGSRSKLATLAPSTTIDFVREQLENASHAVSELKNMRERAMADTPVNRRPSTCDVNAFLQVLAQHSDWIGVNKGIKLIRTRVDHTVYVNVDREQISRALSNLVMNATEALEDTEEPLIRIEVQHRPDCKEVAISISDNGPGLNQAQREEFRIHHRVRSTKPFAVGGAGIKEAARCCSDNGGRLELLDTPDRGTTFSVVLPTCNPRQLRLAVIDCNQIALQSLRTHLGQRGDIKATYFTSPACLISRSAQETDMHKFDFILLDCWFADSSANGVDLYRDLSSRDAALARKIILMSGDDQYLHLQGVKIHHKFNEILNHIDDFIVAMHSRQL